MLTKMNNLHENFKRDTNAVGGKICDFSARFKFSLDFWLKISQLKLEVL
jgi:hypothetical protein